jgi:hypothetical protein
LTAGQAWQRCRESLADPAAFGIADMWGLSFIRGNLLRDLAALNKVELLPWDTWGDVIDSDELITDAERLLCDQVAALATATANDRFAELRQFYHDQDALRPPPPFREGLLEKDRTGGTGKNPLAP